MPIRYTIQLDDREVEVTDAVPRSATGRAHVAFRSLEAGTHMLVVGVQGDADGRNVGDGPAWTGAVRVPGDPSVVSHTTTLPDDP